MGDLSDLDVARKFIALGNFEDKVGSTLKHTLRLRAGDVPAGNSLVGIGDALAQLRNEAGLNSAQVTISRGPEQITIEVTKSTFDRLKAYVAPIEKSPPRFS